MVIEHTLTRLVVVVVVVMEYKKRNGAQHARGQSVSSFTHFFIHQIMN
jgi:hypothetical protein